MKALRFWIYQRLQWLANKVTGFAPPTIWPNMTDQDNRP
jgi:hypothetical protein